jgi:hypothetical protein
MIRGYPNGVTRLAMSRALTAEHIGSVEGSRGTETSKYPDEKKVKYDSVSSGERTRSSLNQSACRLGSWGRFLALRESSRAAWEGRPQRVRVP